MDLNVIITANGPGELATWVTPVVEALRTQLPDIRPIIALVPCPHSSGYEEKSPKSTLKHLYTLIKFPGGVSHKPPLQHQEAA